ncbi:hypothetical protein [Flavobacterium sp.]|uniref:hypothetical protein n=2 Tax=Flavobacterium sp. TaxID=239 RepID=UPI00404B746A
MSLYGKSKARAYIDRRAGLQQTKRLLRLIPSLLPTVPAVSLSGIKQYKGRSLRGQAPSRTAVKNKIDVKSIKTQVRNIQKNLTSNTGYLTHKKREATSVACEVNEMNMISISPCSTTTLEDAITSVPYFTGGALANINLTDDAFQRKVLFKSVSSGLNIRNNRVTPCEVRVYVYKIKADTSNSPSTLFQTGLADQMDAAQPKHPMLYPSDIEQVKALWTQVKCIKKILNTGQEMNVSHTVKDIQYDTSLTDTHALAFQRAIKSFCFVIRLEGRPCHENNASSNIGTCDSKITIITDTVKKIEYDSGSNGTKRIITINNSSGLTDAVIGQSTKRIQNSAGTEGY